MPRLTRIYTRTGDDGSTGLGDGRRVPKTSTRIAAIGDIDELNSVLGVVRALADLPEIDPILESVQHRLFDIGGELSMPGHELVAERWTERLEEWLDGLNASLPAHL